MELCEGGALVTYLSFFPNPNIATIILKQVMSALCRIPWLGSVHRDMKAQNHCPGGVLGIMGQDPSVSKSNRLQVDIFRLFFIDSFRQVEEKISTMEIIPSTISFINGYLSTITQ